ncbi:MAG: carboxymuconolactone decarboxylase family protein [Candidatus Bathyarchaeia archaeon]|nr:carboxymuconolactone decarboxylase family protein [Candidatus Bathyarchaeota archaeon]
MVQDVDDKYKERLEELRRDLGDLMSSVPELSRFAQYVYIAEEKKFLDIKTKELISLAIAVAIRCEDCILWHLDAAIKAGARKEEIMDALKVAVAMAGSPALVYAVKAYKAMTSFL